MKDEWDFDDDDDEDEKGGKAAPAIASSPRRNIAARKKPSPSPSPISASSEKSKDTTAKAKSPTSASSRGRQRDSSPASSSAASSSAASSSQSPFSTTSSGAAAQPRTRTARLKARGEINKSSSRKVRFAAHATFSTSDEASSAATVPSANKGYHLSFVEKTAMNKNLKPKKLKRPWNLKEDNTNEDDEDGPPEHESPKIKTQDTKPPVVRTSSVDVYAVRDTAKVQRQADELRYCCDTLRSSRKATRQVEAIADLGLMLANRKTRWSLLLSSDHHHDGDAAEGSAPLDVLLNLLTWVKEQRESAIVVSVPSTSVGSGRTKTSRQANAEPSSPGTPVIQEGMSQSVADAVGIIWHFLSIDCTMVNDPSLSAARNLRERLLSNRDVVQGILEMVADDPYLSLVVGNDPPYNHLSTECLSQQSGSSLSSSVPDSPDSTGSLDPTVQGRWRKRRRKLLASAPTLDVVPETGLLPENLDNEQKPKDLWSYASESTTAKNHDGDSVSSTTSHVSDLKAQLDKVMEKVKTTVDVAGAASHSCGSDRNELLARLPLLSLYRIVSGKFEGSDKSCIDDEIDESPLDDDEDELTRNPLLRTNALLADTGAIPLIARATSKTAVAIVHHLKHRRACDGCEKYLRWKFCKMTSLVDDTCLFTDANRAAFSTEGFASETGGFLLINIATVLRSLLETNKLFDGDAWGDVALAALRSLTSLTHDNEMASRDLHASFIKWNGVRRCSSLSVIVDVLYEVSSKDGDMTIYCLNTLANTIEVESGGSWEPFAALTVGQHKEPFLKWLTEYVVEETQSFQDALVESSFGSSQDRHSERQLDKSENEALMMAGNAFIFLAYVLVRASTKAAIHVQDDILGQLPGATVATKLLFIKNTLKAFCNLYHFSVGALSLAIVAPVKKLLAELELAYGEKFV